MPIDEVDNIAQGRVWAGSKAKELGLVDSIGDLQMAISRAAELSGIDEYKILYPSQTVDWREQLIKRFTGYLNLLLPSYLRENLFFRETVHILKDVDKFNDPKNLYIICEDCQI